MKIYSLQWNKLKLPVADETSLWAAILTVVLGEFLAVVLVVGIPGVEAVVVEAGISRWWTANYFSVFQLYYQKKDGT